VVVVVVSRPIPGWPGYHATEDGQVLGKRGHPLRGRPHWRTGHLRVRLYGEPGPGRVRTLRGAWADVYAHVLVCLAFHGAPPDGEYLVCHADGDSQNNHPDNLRWGTRQANADDAARHAGGSVDSGGFDWATGG
jgi:hypothetical protein